MEYDCEIVLANKVIAGYNKVATPLCTMCANKGCTNPIVEKKISVFGKVMSTKVYESYGSYFLVTRCEGFQRIFEDEVQGDEDKK